MPWSGRRRRSRGRRAGHRDVLRVEAAMASATVIDCSGCHGSRPSRARPTAAAMVTHGSSGATGASEPSARVAPASSRLRSVKARSVRPAQ